MATTGNQLCVGTGTTETSRTLPGYRLFLVVPVLWIRLLQTLVAGLQMMGVVLGRHKDNLTATSMVVPNTVSGLSNLCTYSNI